jgi:hypothetical protein
MILTTRTYINLGYHDLGEIKVHPFFQGLDWGALKERRVLPSMIPYVPTQAPDALQEDPSVIDDENVKLPFFVTRREVTPEEKDTHGWKPEVILPYPNSTALRKLEAHFERL